MADGSVEAKGVDTRVSFDGVSVTIRPDLFARFRSRLKRRDKGDRVISIDDIVAVELVASTALWNGFLRFTLAGDEGVAVDPRPLTTAAAAKRAVRDPNAVVFSRYQVADFTALHDAIASAIARRAAG